MTTTFVGHFLGPNTHASRPAAAGLPEGTMYVCTTHNKIERVVAAAWVDYATLGSGLTVSTDGIWDSKGDLAAASGPDAAAKLPVGTNGQVLTADSAQTLGVKWAAAATGGGMVADTLWDAKGDLAVASAADTAARLPVGTNNQVLTADSAQTLGVKWATPSAGSAGALTLISTITLSSPGTIDFTSIPGTYNDLLLTVIAKSPNASTFDTFEVTFNNDTTASYFFIAHQVRGTGTPVIVEQAATTAIRPQTIGASATFANAFTVGNWVIDGYASTAWVKALQATTTYPALAIASGFGLEQLTGMWNKTTAITRITIGTTNGTSCVTGSQARLYGRL